MWGELPARPGPLSTVYFLFRSLRASIERGSLTAICAKGSRYIDVFSHVCLCSCPRSVSPHRMLDQTDFLSYVLGTKRTLLIRLSPWPALCLQVVSLLDRRYRYEGMFIRRPTGDSNTSSSHSSTGRISQSTDPFNVHSVFVSPNHGASTLAPGACLYREHPKLIPSQHLSAAR